MDVKQRWREFRAWQLEPIRYDDVSQTPQHCVNCGQDYNGSYCPRCGQKTGVGRVNWDTVRNGVMLIWGMDSRSLPYTLLQLVLRPGHLIGDYISGKLQVSFPPVKMMLLVAIAYMVLNSLGGLIWPPQASQPVKDEFDMLLTAYVQWMERNPGWGLMTVTIYFILPTWLLWRHAPRHARHTLPEGFFIQVFMTTLLLVIACIGVFMGDWLLWLIPTYYLIAYKQLFGYGWWGTLWRMVLCFVIVIMQIAFVQNTAETIFIPHTVENKLHKVITGFVLIALLSAGLLGASYAIGRRTERKRLQKQE